MDVHNKIVEDVAAQVRCFFKCGESYRISHGSTNSTRPRPGPNQNIIDISALRNVVSVNTETRTALVEPNVPMDRLVEATLPYGLVPPVVMEFPGITAGGGFSGTSGESSSFRHGFFNDTINYVEMILGNGDLVKASRTERPDLFHGAAGAAGTLGITTLMEVQLVVAQKYVKTTYCRTTTTAEAITVTEAATKDPKNDYVDGILFSQHHGVIVTGELTNEIPDDVKPRTFSDASDPWFYMYVEERTQGLPSGSCIVDYIPLGEYFFRYDRAGFWVGRHGYTYFKYIPFNSFFRWFLDDFSHTRTLYHALHGSGISSELVVQDLGLPYDTAEKFINYVDEDFGIWPLWLCPLRETSMPTFHPVSTDKEGPLIDVSEKADTNATTVSRPMLNIGVWGWGPKDYEEFVKRNRGMEDKLAELGGRKWLYAHTYYSEDEFWKVYNRPWYQALREKYFATTLPTVYDKVKIDVDAKRKERSQWKTSLYSKWPIGGLYGMAIAIMSGDINLHRKALWKYQGEDNNNNN